MSDLSPERLRQLPMAELTSYLHRREVLRRGAIAGGALVAGPWLLSRPGHSAAPTVGGHLTFGADPTREMSVSWATPERVESPVLDLGTSTRYGRTLRAETRAVSGTESVYHHVRLTGLKPDTTYHYRVRHKGGGSGNQAFRTAPSVTRPFRFTAFGDQGVSETAAATTARTVALNPAFHIHVGDLCYGNSTGTGETGTTDHTVWDRWLAMVSQQALRAPWMPGVGNHEMEPGYGDQGYGGFLARFDLPRNGVQGGAPTYSFRYGNVGVVMLDGNDASYEIAHNNGWLGPAQDKWLAHTLAGLRADRRVDFVVVGFHNCMYCTNAVHASDGGNRRRWQGIFDQFAVDVVVNGHNHQYERTHAMRDGAVTKQVPVGGRVAPATDGTVYVTAGGGGQAAYPVTLYPLSYTVEEGGLRVPEVVEWSAVRSFDPSVLVADVTPAKPGVAATMRLRAVTPDGTVIDDLTLEAPRR